MHSRTSLVNLDYSRGFDPAPYSSYDLPFYDAAFLSIYAMYEWNRGGKIALMWTFVGLKMLIIRMAIKWYTNKTY